MRAIDNRPYLYADTPILIITFISKAQAEGDEILGDVIGCVVGYYIDGAGFAFAEISAAEDKIGDGEEDARDKHHYTAGVFEAVE